MQDRKVSPNRTDRGRIGETLTASSRVAIQNNDEPCAIEIPDSQTDVGCIVQQAGHELLCDDITNAVTRSEHDERSSTRVGVLLLHGIEQSTPSPGRVLA